MTLCPIVGTHVGVVTGNGCGEKVVQWVFRSVSVAGNDIGTDTEIMEVGYNGDGFVEMLDKLGHWSGASAIAVKFQESATLTMGRDI